MLCSLPLYAAIHARWPQARVTLLAAPTRYPIPLTALNPFLDDVMYYRKGSFATVLGNHRDIRRRNFDAAFVPSTVALSRTSHLAAFLSGARLRVGVRAIDGVENPSHLFLNRKIDVQWVTGRVHQMQRNLQIAEAAGCALSDREMAALAIPLDADAASEAGKWMSRFPADMPVIGVHPGAGKEENVWPTEYFFRVVRRLHEEHGAGVLITAGAVDHDEVSMLTALCTAHAIPHHVLQQADIPLLSAIMRRLRLYLCNDTGTMHVAAFSGCATVSLFGPTQAWEWAPQGEHHRCLLSEDGEIGAIDPDDVYAACMELMDERGAD